MKKRQIKYNWNLFKCAIYAVIIFKGLVEFAFVMKAPKKQTDILLKKVGNRLKELRIKKGFTSYEEFAWSFDLDRKQYWRIENGANITLKSLLRILSIHQISLEDFSKGLEK
jgi:hypothetical protein